MNIKTKNHSPISAEAALLKAQKSEKADKSQKMESQNVEKTPHHRKSYNVSLSPESQSIKEAHQKAYEIAMNTPGMREDRVKALREKIKNGTYEPDPGKIADGMLREAIKDKLAMSE